MKNLVTHSISKARSVQKKRQLRQILLLCAVILLLIIAMVVIRVSIMKNAMDAMYPTDSAVAGTTAPSDLQTSAPASSDDSSDPSSAPATDTTASATDTSAPATDTTASGTSAGETGTAPSETPETTAASTGPAAILPETDVYIPVTSTLQTISHKARDSAYHTLQKDVQTLIDTQVGVRCGFYYINLQNNEEFGYNETAPFVVGAAINLPINTMLYDQVREGTLALTEIMSFTGADKVDGSGNLQNEAAGTQHYIRELSQLSIIQSDNTAAEMLLRRMDGIDSVNDSLKLISDFVDFRTPVTYTDFDHVQRSGKNRSCALDQAKYAAYFYKEYMSYPTVYQSLFNDLAHASSDWGVGSSLPSDVLVCHKTGSNVTFSSETDTALIFADEPYVLSVTVECADAVTAKDLQKQLGDLVYAYLHGCYS